MKKKGITLLLALVLAFSLVGCGGTSGASADGTQTDDASTTGTNPGGETVKIICPYGVGGTADAIARKYAVVAGELYPEYNFIVENMTGGDGFSAATFYTEEDPSTTDLLIYGYGVAYRYELGTQFGTEVVDFDRNEIYPVASIDDRTWILYAAPDTTLEDVLEKAKSGGLKMSGGNALSDPHLTLGSLLALTGGTVTCVPYDGGAAQKKGLTDGEVDVFVGSSQAGMEDVEAGTIVPILAFSETAFEGFNGPDGPITVPSVAGDDIADALDPSLDYTGSILPAGGFIATRTGASQEWIDKVTEISQAVWADEAFYGWIADNLLNNFQVYDQEAYDHLEEACVKSVAAFQLLSGN